LEEERKEGGEFREEEFFGDVGNDVREGDQVIRSYT